MMKPVAGIASVSEGNLVSHVQLLARNLGIPNAVLSPRALRGARGPLRGGRLLRSFASGHGLDESRPRR